jgi:MFS family permease
MAATAQAVGFSGEEKRVIFASSLGTVFEWYDFYLYAVLAPFFAALFFPPGNQTAALLSAFAAYAAGFLVRPFGALLFGRIGDMVGRKYTFLITIVVMGAATFAVGLLPTYATVGWFAPILMVTLSHDRLISGAADNLSVPQQYGRKGVRRLGLARAVLVVADPPRVFRLHPAEAARIAGIPEDEGGRERIEIPADRQLP